MDNLAVGPEWYVSKGGWEFDIHGEIWFLLGTVLTNIHFLGFSEGPL